MLHSDNRTPLRTALSRRRLSPSTNRLSRSHARSENRPAQQAQRILQSREQRRLRVQHGRQLQRLWRHRSDVAAVVPSCDTPRAHLGAAGLVHSARPRPVRNLDHLRPTTRSTRATYPASSSPSLQLSYRKVSVTSPCCPATPSLRQEGDRSEVHPLRC